jgi:hypothetical protein
MLSDSRWFTAPLSPYHLNIDQLPVDTFSFQIFCLCALTMKSCRGSNSDNLATFPRLASFKLLPSLHSACLHANHILVPIGWSKIADTLRINPWVPYNHFVQVVPDDGELLLAPFGNGDRRSWSSSRCVHSIGLASDLDWTVGGSGCADRGSHLVDV